MNVTVWLLRITLLAHAAAAVAQPILAGFYLSGQFDALAVHEAIGSFMMFGVLASWLAAAAHWVFGRGRGWPVAVTLVMLVAEPIQLGFGYSRDLAVHIPLGVVIVAVAVALAGWAWTPGSRHRRRSWRRSQRRSDQQRVSAGVSP